VAESFGGCLGLRVAAAAPELVERLVLINPATSFSRALGGLPGIIASTNLLSLFPEPLYQASSPVDVAFTSGWPVTHPVTAPLEL
jgi:pimeloyl-ACP methyl ester carboxylesterase